MGKQLLDALLSLKLSAPPWSSFDNEEERPDLPNNQTLIKCCMRCFNFFYFINTTAVHLVQNCCSFMCTKVLPEPDNTN